MNGRDLARMSLRTRLTLTFAPATAAVLTALGGFVYLQLGHALLAGVDTDLRSRAGVVVAQLSGARPAQQVRLDTGRGFLDQDESFAQVLSRDGAVLQSTQAVAAAAMIPSGRVAGIRRSTLLTRTVTGVQEPARLLATPATLAGRPVLVVVGATLGDRDDALHHLLVLLLAAGGVGLLLVAASGWLLAGAALRPVERIRRRAAEISRLDPQSRLPVPATGDELSQLATTLNGLLARLHTAVERERRFASDASHELRTPLAVLKAELDLALLRPRTAAELTGTVRTAAAETDHLVRLAEDLLVLARSQQGRLPVRRQDTDLTRLLEDAAEAFRGPIALRDGRIAVQVEGPTGGRVRVDPVRMRQALDNLLDNAVRHGGGRIQVTASAGRGRLRIEVTDDGAGIPADLVSVAFEPFVHRDRPADGREGNGHRSTGLGLSIVRAVAEAHHGTARIARGPAGGTRIILDLALR